MKSFFEKIDFLSPKITLFYRYKLRHSSSVGGLLTLAMIIICILFISKFLFSLFHHSSPSVIFYRKYEKDLAKYSLDSSSILHLIWLNNNNYSFKSILNTKAIRIILLAEENNNKTNISNLKNYEHWVYDSCDKNDLKNYEKLIFNDEYINNNNDISNAICLRYYYDKTEQKYYSSKNQNNIFRYPYLEHGTSNKNNLMLSIIFEKCSNNSITNKIFGNCENEEYILNYLKDYNSAYIQILDHQVDLTDFDKPIQTYFMGISSLLWHDNSYEVKNINLSPLLIRSSQNIIKDGYIEKSTVIVDSIQSYIVSSHSQILLKYLLSIQNYKQIYERKYNDLFDAFSSIGGIVQFCYYTFYIINYFYNDFILILNTQNLFLNDPKNKKISKLIPLNKYTNILDSRKLSRNNTLMKNYESSKFLQELKFYKLISKDRNNNNNNNDGDLSSLQLSESVNDKESRFNFNKKKDDFLYTISRRSQQINSKSFLKFGLKDDQKKKVGLRYSMFNPKSTDIISPIHRIGYYKGNNFSNLLSSNGVLSDIKENITFENNNNNNNLYSKKITFIDNRDRKYNYNKINNNNDNSFAENAKICHYLKNKRNTILQENNKFYPKKNPNKKMQKTLLDISKDKYYSEKLNFKEYICFMCSIKNKRRDILIIQKFRQKLLSEEHFYKSHLFIYLIIQKIKINKEDKSDIKELYSEL